MLDRSLAETALESSGASPVTKETSPSDNDLTSGGGTDANVPYSERAVFMWLVGPVVGTHCR